VKVLLDEKEFDVFVTVDRKITVKQDLTGLTPSSAERRQNG
jgi:hypothetical protein